MVKVLPLTTAFAVVLAVVAETAVAVEPTPNATLLSSVTELLLPSARLSVPEALAVSPIAMLLMPLAFAPKPTAVEFRPEARVLKVASAPMARLPFPADSAPLPIATDRPEEEDAFALSPIATDPPKGATAPGPKVTDVAACTCTEKSNGILANVRPKTLNTWVRASNLNLARQEANIILGLDLSFPRRLANSETTTKRPNAAFQTTE